MSYLNTTSSNVTPYIYVHCHFGKKSASDLRRIGKVKAVPIQARTGPKCPSKLRFPDFVTTAQDGGKVISLTHRPPLLLRKCSWYSFLLEAESTPGP